MDGVHPHFAVRTPYGFLLLLLLLLQPLAEAQSICTGPTDVTLPENTEVGEVVATITTAQDVTLEFAPTNQDNSFELKGNELKIKMPLDYETAKTHKVYIDCRGTSGSLSNLAIVVIVTNVNDNAPVFERDSYDVPFDEMSPVNAVLDTFPAVDLDGATVYYTLTPESSGFKLESPTSPIIVAATLLDYDKVKKVELTLTAQDTPLTSNIETSLNSSITITVTIIDVDNRPPWFQPCTNYTLSGALICQTSGYTGTVILNEENVVVLPLQPRPIHAIDGDFGINEEIMYSFLTGNKSGAFEIDQTTGNITVWNTAMLKIMSETISLTVVAAQKNNSYQFATTTVTITLQEMSLSPPKFEMTEYEGVVTAVGNMMLDKNNEYRPLRLIATDADYPATGVKMGVNPHITYSITGSSDFTIIDGYVFMTSNLPGGMLSLQVEARDTSNGDVATTNLSVEVSGVTTTTVGTTFSVTTTPMGDSSTNSKTTEDTGGSDSTGSATQPHTGLTTTTVGTTNSMSTTPMGDSTTNSKTTEDTGDSVSTGSTAQPHTGLTTTIVGTTNSMTTMGDSTTNSKTTEDTGGSDSTGSTAQPHTGLTTTTVGTTNSMTTMGDSTTNSKTTEDTGGSVSTGSTAQPGHTGLTNPTVGTTTSMATTPMGDSTTNSKTTEVIICTTSTAIPSTTSENIISTTLPTEGSVSSGSTVQPHTGVTTMTPINNSTIIISTMSSEGSASTNTPGLTTEGCICTASTAQPDTDCYGPEDMAALGATLGILLLICVVVIVVLACHLRRGKADWRKIYETNIFRSSLGQGSAGQKGGIQYTNDAFQKDEDGDSTGPGHPMGRSVVAFEEPQKAVSNLPVYEATLKSSAPLHALLRDDISQAGSDMSGSEKEVKPILTKERRMDDGYKSVWFKEDIDPDAKEEVVIIPDSQENDSEDEDEERIKRVAFNDADLDSGLGLKMDDPTENSNC